MEISSSSSLSSSSMSEVDVGRWGYLCRCSGAAFSIV